MEIEWEATTRGNRSQHKMLPVNKYRTSALLTLQTQNKHPGLPLLGGEIARYNVVKTTPAVTNSEQAKRVRYELRTRVLGLRCQSDIVALTDDLPCPKVQAYDEPFCSSVQLVFCLGPVL